MKDIGLYQTLTVARMVDFGLYLKNGEDEEVLLPRKYIPEGTKVDDQIRVFLYTDSEDRPVTTTLAPKAALGECATMEVVSVTRFGAFMDWGLEKDLFIPLRHQQPRLQVGQRAVVRVVLDEKSGRLFGSTRQDRFIQNSPKGFKLAQPVDLLILEESPLGFTALIDGRYRGMLFRNELFEPICVGDSKQGYIKAIRKDGKVDLALRASNEAGKKQGCDLLLQSLKEAGGSLPVGYKIDPDEAVRRFGMSRKAFKRALTQLSEQGAITIHEGGITLL